METVFPETNHLFRLISKYYDIELTETPDYVIDAGNGFEHLNYNCIKIVVVGENCTPDFNCFDYAIGMDELSFGDRYFRFPHFCLYPEFATMTNTPEGISDEELVNRKFCSYVVSNGKGDPLRQWFYAKLSTYKKIDSGGRFMNNLGGPVPDKLAFCAKYKFNIAFENSVVPGYTTEKVMQPLTVNSVPIYYGNPHVEADFLTDCMVIIRDKDDVERAIEEIIHLDQDDAAYLKKCRSQRLAHGTPQFYFNGIEQFLRNIFEQPLTKAFRLIDYGHQPLIRYRYKQLIEQDKQIRKIWYLPRRILGKILRLLGQ